MISHAQLPFGRLEAERAFERASRARRRAALVRALKRSERERLAIHDMPSPRPARVREIPLDAITGTLEPSRAAQFDGEFRPTKRARCRWLRIWLAEQAGEVLPPISVAPVRDGYAVRDGHHRVSVAKARGAVTINAYIN
jgi:hypothetical protein